MNAAVQTTEGLAGPRATQFALFLNNKVGALAGVVGLLQERRIELLGLAIEDSADCAIVRMVVSDPEGARELFVLQGLTFASTSILVAELKGGASELPKLLSVLLMAEVNIHGSYALLPQPRGRSALALCVEDNDCAQAALLSHGFALLSQRDISR